MDWIQTLSVMATVIASAYYIHREVQRAIRATAQRTDRLYEWMWSPHNKHLCSRCGNLEEVSNEKTSPKK